MAIAYIRCKTYHSLGPGVRNPDFVACEISAFPQAKEVKLDPYKSLMFHLVSVAEPADLSMTLSETPKFISNHGPQEAAYQSQLTSISFSLKLAIFQR